MQLSLNPYRHETGTAHGPISVSANTSFRDWCHRNIGLWLSTICRVNHERVIDQLKWLCKFCNGPADHKSHPLYCSWATKDDSFDLIENK